MEMDDKLRAAIELAGDRLAGAQEGLGHLTCHEISGVVDLLILAGMPETATDIVHWHGLSDDDEYDDHNAVRRLADDSPGGGAYKWAKGFVDVRGAELVEEAEEAVCKCR